MTISKQVAELEQRALDAEDALAGMRAGLSGALFSQHDRYSKALKRGYEEGDMYLSGLRAGLRNSPAPETTTAAPAAAKATAVARPMPDAAPVTSATLPPKSYFTIVFSPVWKSKCRMAAHSRPMSGQRPCTHVWQMPVPTIPALSS